MERELRSVIGYHLSARDGQIGKVEEFYFDDSSWKIRYLIVKTGGWLSGRKVLISPAAVAAGASHSGDFPVSLSMQQVRDSPDIDTDQPISRRQEIRLYGHYAWQPYWGSGFYAGGFANISDAPEADPHPLIDEKKIIEKPNAGSTKIPSPHLRSTERITGYHIRTEDGEIGHIIDFIFDDETWLISDLVIDTHHWFGGKKVLIPVKLVREIRWEEAKVFVDMSVNGLLHSPPADQPQKGKTGKDK
jgi:uncharacterized protein YrrD